MGRTYLLGGEDGHTPFVVSDFAIWAELFGALNRRVAFDVVEGVEISTVFLGLDHAFGNGPPLLFETMVFGGELDQEQERCSTWDEAVAQHAAMVARVTGRQKQEAAHDN